MKNITVVVIAFAAISIIGCGEAEKPRLVLKEGEASLYEGWMQEPHLYVAGKEVFVTVSPQWGVVTAGGRLRPTSYQFVKTGSVVTGVKVTLNYNNDMKKWIFPEAGIVISLPLPRK